MVGQERYLSSFKRSKTRKLSIEQTKLSTPNQSNRHLVMGDNCLGGCFIANWYFFLGYFMGVSKAFKECFKGGSNELFGCSILFGKRVIFEHSCHCNDRCKFAWTEKPQKTQLFMYHDHELPLKHPFPDTSGQFKIWKPWASAPGNNNSPKKMTSLVMNSLLALILLSFILVCVAGLCWSLHLLFVI